MWLIELCFSFSGEREELSADDIKNLGNWARDVFERIYSSQMPMKALRVMAGHGDGKGCYHIKRDIPVPDILRRMVFPWIEICFLQICGTSFITAGAFLKKMDNLRDVIIQDAACMILRGRVDHVIFKLKVFKSTEFLDFVRVMDSHLKTSK